MCIELSLDNWDTSYNFENKVIFIIFENVTMNLIFSQICFGSLESTITNNLTLDY